MQKFIFFLISALIGIELFAGIIVAPTLFYPQRFGIDLPLTLFQSGLLMTRIFVVLSYTLFAVSFISELYALWRREIFCLAMMTLILIFAGIFTFYLTPFITHAQSLGEIATQSAEFIKIHTYSEWCLKLIVFFQFIALFSFHPKDKDSAL